jgi:predicted ribonuclease YlaK
MIEVETEKDHLLSFRNKKEQIVKIKTPKPSKPFILKKINPITINQNKAFKSYNEDKNLLFHGMAGTGKSFISIYLALDEIMDISEKSPYDSLVIIRSVVPTRDVGFLPGSVIEKSQEYEAPYDNICAELFGVSDAYKQLKNKELIKFKTTSFIRGITLKNSIILVDEIQNMDADELKSIITRTGENCKIIFSGDFKQSDFRGRDKEYKNDVIHFMNILKTMPDDFDIVEFGINDIVRSSLVKNFLIAENNYMSNV